MMDDTQIRIDEHDYNSVINDNIRLRLENKQLKEEVEHLHEVNRVIYQELARMANECYNHLKN